MHIINRRKTGFISLYPIYCLEYANVVAIQIQNIFMNTAPGDFGVMGSVGEWKVGRRTCNCPFLFWFQLYDTFELFSITFCLFPQGLYGEKSSFLDYLWRSSYPGITSVHTDRLDGTSADYYSTCLLLYERKCLPLRRCIRVEDREIEWESIASLSFLVVLVSANTVHLLINLYRLILSITVKYYFCPIALNAVLS